MRNDGKEKDIIHEYELRRWHVISIVFEVFNVMCSASWRKKTFTSVLPPLIGETNEFSTKVYGPVAFCMCTCYGATVANRFH